MAETSIIPAPTRDGLECLTLAIAALGPETPHDTMAAWLLAIGTLKVAIREADAMLEQQAIEWIRENGQDIDCGNHRRYIGIPKETKPRDVKETARVLLEEHGPEVLADCLSSSAIKIGAARKALPPADFERLFVTTEKAELATGKPAKRLLSTAPEYCKS